MLTFCSVIHSRTSRARDQREENSTAKVTGGHQQTLQISRTKNGKMIR
jgi:hypothetical protein